MLHGTEAVPFEPKRSTGVGGMEGAIKLNNRQIRHRILRIFTANVTRVHIDSVDEGQPLEGGFQTGKLLVAREMQFPILLANVQFAKNSRAHEDEFLHLISSVGLQGPREQGLDSTIYLCLERPLKYQQAFLSDELFLGETVRKAMKLKFELGFTHTRHV